MMRSKLVVVVCVMAAMCVSACSDPETPEDVALCGAGDEVHSSDQRACVYKQAIIETGFKCPDALSKKREYGGLVICTAEDTLTPSLRKKLHQNYMDQMLPPEDAPLCMSAADCAAGQVCKRGACQVMTAECVTAADCGVGSGCVNGMCKAVVPPSCMSDAQCPAGQICLEGSCAVASRCMTSMDCGVGATCVDNLCQALVPPSCMSDADCGVGSGCVNGMCKAVVPPSCMSDAQCPAGMICMGGVCTAP